MTTTTAKLTDLLAEERRLFREYDEPNGRRIHILRAQIRAYPCTGEGDVLAKAKWLLQVLADNEETIDDAIRAEGLTDKGMAFGVLRDFMQVHGLAPQVIPSVSAMPAASQAVN